MQQITKVNEIPGAGNVLLYLFTAESPGLRQSLAKLVRKNPELQFVIADVSVPSDIDDEYSVSSVPAFMFLRDGVLIGSYSGTDLRHVASLIRGCA